MIMSPDFFTSFRSSGQVEFNYDHYLDNVMIMGRQIHKWKTTTEYSNI